MRYDHHPDPAIAFCVEVEEIEGEAYNARVGLTDREAVGMRAQRAMQFRVGGDLHAIRAKDRLREVIAEF